MGLSNRVQMLLIKTVEEKTAGGVGCARESCNNEEDTCLLTTCNLVGTTVGYFIYFISLYPSKNCNNSNNKKSVIGNIYRVITVYRPCSKRFTFVMTLNLQANKHFF